MITKQELIEYDLTHEHGGNGLAMVEDIDPEWCRVVRLGTPITHAMLAWKPKLAVTMLQKDKNSPPEPRTLVLSSRFDDAFMGELAKLRRAFKSGELIVKDTRIIQNKG